jgi:hypothetical protein
MVEPEYGELQPTFKSVMREYYHTALKNTYTIVVMHDLLKRFARNAIEQGL